VTVTHGDPVASRATMEVGLVVTPVVDTKAVEQLADAVKCVLDERYPRVAWRVAAMRDALVSPPASLVEIVDAARARLLDEDWDLVVYVTELPLRIARRPVLTHSSRTHSAAIVSLPAHGLMHSNRRLAKSVAEAVGAVVGDSTERRDENTSRHQRHVQQRLTQLADDVEGADALEGVALVTRVALGNLRLILGMVRANHPWRLVAGLSRALIAALGVAAFAVITSDVWRIAASLAAPRLALLCLATIATAVTTLITAHELWERPPDRRVREQAILFNLVTTITVAFGIVALYVALCALSLGAGALTLEPSVMASQIGRSTYVGDYVRLALVAGSLATVGGALGGALESDAAVREAAYGYRGD
jgi:uncharacterized membrane protein